MSVNFVSDSFADKKIKFHLGQTRNVDDLKFTFLSVDDSRCPSDVTCVWAGQVTATIQIENQTNSKVIDFAPGDSYTFFSPYEIVLLDVSPYPTSEKIPDHHIATLAMFSLDGTPPCEKHMTIKDGLCVPESSRPLDFTDTGESTRFLYVYSSLSLIVTVIGFFVIKKWRNRK
ncbi:hypothetical protein K0U27_02835 [archaeon]|nr:hypothetical protein [archaeon]